MSIYVEIERHLLINACNDLHKIQKNEGHTISPTKISIYSNISQNSHLLKFFLSVQKVHQPRVMYYRTRSSDVVYSVAMNDG